jgi:hypothetical protein
MAATPSEADDNSQLTFAGCLLVLLSLAVIVAVALTLVRWRDPDSGETLPGEALVLIPVVAGALFCAIVGGLLRMLGVRVLARPMKESCDRPNDFERIIGDALAVFKGEKHIAEPPASQSRTGTGAPAGPAEPPEEELARLRKRLEDLEGKKRDESIQRKEGTS